MAIYRAKGRGREQLVRLILEPIEPAPDKHEDHVMVDPLLPSDLGVSNESVVRLIVQADEFAQESSGKPKTKRIAALRSTRIH